MRKYGIAIVTSYLATLITIRFGDNTLDKNPFMQCQRSLVVDTSECIPDLRVLTNLEHELKH